MKVIRNCSVRGKEGPSLREIPQEGWAARTGWSDGTRGSKSEGRAEVDRAKISSPGHRGTSSLRPCLCSPANLIPVAPGTLQTAANVR